MQYFYDSFREKKTFKRCTFFYNFSELTNNFPAETTATNIKFGKGVSVHLPNYYLVKTLFDTISFGGDSI